MGEIPRTYLIGKLRQTGRLAGREALPDFKAAIDSFAEKVAKLASEKCSERGAKTISSSDINLAVMALKSN